MKRDPRSFRLLRTSIFLSTLVFALPAHSQLRPGDIDTTFGDGGVSLTRVGNIFTGYNGPSTMLLQPDGKILVCGQIDNYGDDGNFFLARLTSSGALDPTFGAQGMIISSNNDPYPGADMALQPDGRIVIVGHNRSQVSLQRYESDGLIDHSFGDGGTATLEIEGNASSVALQSDGKIVIAMHRWEEPPRLARLNSDGSLDETFAEGGVLLSDPADMRGISKIFTQADGKLVTIGGIPHETCCSTRGIAIVRYLSNGSRDSSFGSNGLAFRSNLPVEYPEDAAVQPDGRIVVSSRGFVSPPYQSRLTRFNTDGSIDSSFAVGSTTLYGVPWKLAIQQDGKLIIAGASLIPPNTHQASFVRFTQNGSPDSGFGINSVASPGYGANPTDVLIQSDGKILSFGLASGYGGAYEYWITRTHGDPRFSVSGRVTSPQGQGLRNVPVTITGSDGTARTVTTSSFGIYQFENIADGQTYTLSVASKRYRFAPRFVQVSSDLSNIDLIGQE